jgi:hypothetical protein
MSPRPNALGIPVAGDGWFFRRHRIKVIPVIRGPDIAGRVNRNVGEPLDTAAREYVDDIAALRVRRMSLRLVAGHQHDFTSFEVGHPDVIIAVNVEAQGALIVPSPV